MKTFLAKKQKAQDKLAKAKLKVSKIQAEYDKQDLKIKEQSRKEDAPFFSKKSFHFFAPFFLAR